MSCHFNPIFPPHLELGEAEQGPAKRKKVTFSSDTRLYDRWTKMGGTPVLSSPSCDVMAPDSKCSSLSEMVNQVCAIADRTKLDDDHVMAGIINICTEMAGCDDDDAIAAAFYAGADQLTAFETTGVLSIHKPSDDTDTSDNIGSPRAIANMGTMVVYKPVM